MKPELRLIQSEKQVAADIEFYNMVTTVLSDGQITPMDKLHDAYKDILELHGLVDMDITLNKLKSKIQENISHVVFSQTRKNCPEMICSKAMKDKAVGQAAAAETDMNKDTQSVFNCAKIIRQHVLHSRKIAWQFDGSLGNGHVPSLL